MNLEELDVEITAIVERYSNEIETFLQELKETLDTSDIAGLVFTHIKSLGELDSLNFTSPVADTLSWHVGTNPSIMEGFSKVHRKKRIWENFDAKDSITVDHVKSEVVYLCTKFVLDK